MKVRILSILSTPFFSIRDEEPSFSTTNRAAEASLNDTPADNLEKQGELRWRANNLNARCLRGGGAAENSVDLIAEVAPWDPEEPRACAAATSSRAMACASQ